ncbi:hypothetical protein Taro_027287 [Colocasia esculenta]|uniref:Uncharacterized protein n=1 Tax=Colocasia esculenta TaxID=4460 RepID=A0A843VJQ7_COLES|nr:hypothetical protein [Colocasia esculenta]
MGRCKDLPDGTQRWVDDESRDHFERMTQMTTPSLQSEDATPVSAEDAFVAVMGRDRPGRVRCAGKAETLHTWYRRGESSSGGYHTQVQQLQQQLQDQNKKMEELCVERSRDCQELHDLCAERSRDRQELQDLCAERSRDRQELHDLCAERSRDCQELENMRTQMAEMRTFMQQFAAQPSHMSRPGAGLDCEESDESPDNYDDDD